MSVGIRFVVWIGIALGFSTATAPNFPSLVIQSVGDAFGGFFVAIPIAALLIVIFALRWKELAKSMVTEGGASSQLRVRLAGGATLVALVLVEPLMGETLAASGIAIVLTFYAASLLVNPSTWRFMLPYAATYSAAVGAPAVLLWAFGEPFALLSSGLSAKLVNLAGFSVVWQGTQFQLLSKTGEVVSGVVTPSCSSISSVTMFLGLLALMHLDMRKDIRATAKLAVAGVLALILLDSVRILILLWVGFQYGSNALWGVHDWIGYAFFLGFFLAALPIYSRMGGNSVRAAVGSEFISV